MFVYLDESGDTGFKFTAGSSRYFVVTLLLVDDPLPLHAAIVSLRESLGFAATNEFKFYSSSEDVRVSFLRMLRRQNFSVRVLVVDKTLMTQPHMQKRETFYNFLVRMVLTYDNATIRDATLILDESVKSKKSKQRFTAYLRRALNVDKTQRKISGIRYHASDTDTLIQAADMVSGAVYAKYRRGDESYFAIIRSKVGDLWEWKPRAQ